MTKQIIIFCLLTILSTSEAHSADEQSTWPTDSIDIALVGSETKHRSFSVRAAMDFSSIEIAITPRLARYLTVEPKVIDHVNAGDVVDFDFAFNNSGNVSPRFIQGLVKIKSSRGRDGVSEGSSVEDILRVKVKLLSEDNSFIDLILLDSDSESAVSSAQILVDGVPVGETDSLGQFGLAVPEGKFVIGALTDEGLPAFGEAVAVRGESVAITLTTSQSDARPLLQSYTLQTAGVSDGGRLSADLRDVAFNFLLSNDVIAGIDDLNYLIAYPDDQSAEMNVDGFLKLTEYFLIDDQGTIVVSDALGLRSALQLFASPFQLEINAIDLDTGLEYQLATEPLTVEPD